MVISHLVPGLFVPRASCFVPSWRAIRSISGAFSLAKLRIRFSSSGLEGQCRCRDKRNLGGPPRCSAILEKKCDPRTTMLSEALVSHSENHSSSLAVLPGFLDSPRNTSRSVTPEVHERPSWWIRKRKGHPIYAVFEPAIGLLAGVCVSFTRTGLGYFLVL